MTTAIILRRLWGHRALTAVVVAFAIIATLLVMYRPSVFPPGLESRKYDVGVARARMLVDTPDSVVVAVAPKGAETLGARANLLANLMVDGELKAAIARRAGLSPDSVVGVGDSDAGPAPGAKPDDRGSSILRASAPSTVAGWLPIIEIEAQSPSRATAERLATAAVAGVTAYLDSRAATEKVPDARRLRVASIGVTQARDAARGPRPIVALGLGIFVLLLGCAAILAADTLRLALRNEPPAAERPATPPLAVVSTEDEFAERAL